MPRPLLSTLSARLARARRLPRLARLGLRFALAMAGAVCGGTSHAATFIDQKLPYLTRSAQPGFDGPIRFPWIRTEDPEVARHINVFLHQQLLQVLPPADAPFTKPRTIALDDAVMDMDALPLQVANGGRTLTVTVTYQGCGAYCSDGSPSFGFDTRSGRVLAVQELLTPAGQRAVAALVTRDDLAQLRRELKRLHQADAKARKAEDKDRISDQVMLYETCLHDYLPDGLMGADSANDPGALKVADGALVFSRGRCSNHAMQALDDLGNLDTTLTRDVLRPHLSAYGRYLLFGEGDGAVPAINRYAQLYHGTLGAAPVTLYLGLKDAPDSVSELGGARYFYDKYGRAIELNIEQRGDTLVLKEQASDLDPKPALELHRAQDRLVGTWRSGSKTLPVDLAP